MKKSVRAYCQNSGDGADGQYGAPLAATKPISAAKGAPALSTEISARVPLVLTMGVNGASCTQLGDGGLLGAK